MTTPNSANPTLDTLLRRADSLLARLEGLLPAPAAEPDWSASIAFRYRKRAPGAFGGGGHGGVLEPVRHVAPIALDNLKEVDAQKSRLRANTAQFVAGRSGTAGSFAAGLADDNHHMAPVGKARAGGKSNFTNTTNQSA